MTDIVKLARSASIIPPGGTKSDRIRLFPRPNLQIGALRTPHEASSLHQHDFTEITVIESGCGTHRYQNADCPIQAGDVFVVPPHHAHQYTDASQLVVNNIAYYNDGSIPLLEEMTQVAAYRAMFLFEPALRLRNNTTGRLHLNIDQLRDIIATIARLEKALRNQEAAGAACATIYFLQLINDLCTAYESTPPDAGVSILQVGKAITHIENHFYELNSIGDLAKITNLSLRSFQRHFQRATGMSAAHYITHRRIAEARRLLQAGVSVTETALEVGFEDSNYFSQVFHKIVGVPPKRFQTNHQTGTPPKMAPRSHESKLRNSPPQER